jgi:hypothetical protein
VTGARRHRPRKSRSQRTGARPPKVLVDDVYSRHLGALEPTEFIKFIAVVRFMHLPVTKK